MTREFDLPSNQSRRALALFAALILLLTMALGSPPVTRAVTVLASDAFARTVVGGWGSLDTGQAWYITNGNDAATAVNGGVGKMTHSAIGELKARVPTFNAVNVNISAKFRAETLADDTPMSATEFLLYSRYDAEPDFCCYLRLVLSFVSGAASPIMRVDRQSVEFTPSLAQVSLPATNNNPTQAWMLRFETVGTAIRGKAWLASQSEPSTWQIDITDNSVNQVDGVGQDNQFVVGTWTNDTTPAMVIDVDDVLVTAATLLAAPGAPTGVTATAGNAQAAVSWSAPASDGGSPITSYMATSAPGAKTCTTAGALSCMVTGLTNGTPYTFTVTATNVIGTGLASAPSNSVTPNASGATFVPLTPARLLDTRFANGLSGTFSVGVPRTFQVTGRGGVPSGATAVTGNLTVTGQTAAGYAFLGPNPVASPATSTLNFPLGDSRANGVTVALGAGGTLSATYIAPGGSTTHLIFDVTGYFVPGSSGATFVPLTPARLLDTRFANGLSGTFSVGVPRTFQVTGRGGVPSGATAVTGNLTVTGQTAAGYAFLGPNPVASPATSTLNFPLGDSRANGVTVALGAGGTLSATYIAPGGSTTHLIFDVTGYFVPGSSGATFVPLTPARLLDTRFANGLSGTFSVGVPRTFQVTGRGGVPSGATAVTGNLTVTGQTAAGYAFLGPNPVASPATSTLNFPLGDSRANGVTVALGAGGTLSATYIAPGGSTTHLIFDVTGYFVP